jgi:hypothetical protein
MKLICLALAVLISGAGWTDAQDTRPGVPVEPVAAILEAFRSHRIIALGEGTHGNEQGHTCASS